MCVLHVIDWLPLCVMSVITVIPIFMGDASQEVQHMPESTEPNTTYTIHIYNKDINKLGTVKNGQQ